MRKCFKWLCWWLENDYLFVSAQTRIGEYAREVLREGDG